VIVRPRCAVMKRIETTRRQQIILVCLTLLAIGSTFPFAMSGKTLGTLLWIGASVLALVMTITRVQVFAKPTLVLMLLFVASFFVPVEIVVARSQSLDISWVHCEVVGLRSRIEQHKPDETTHVIVRGCVPLLGVEPLRVVRISVPEKK
jgi:hypothetical protein